MTRADNPLVRAAARLPASVHAKLLVTFVGTVILLVVLGVLALRVLGESNDRIAALGALQQRATAYQNLQSRAEQVRQLLGTVSGGSDLQTYLSNPSSVPDTESLALVDTAISASLAQVGPATREAIALGPPQEESASLHQIQHDYDDLTGIMAQISAASADAAQTQRLHKQAETLATSLADVANKLVGDTQSATGQLILQNQAAFSDSQRLFIGVAIGSIILALLLGYVLSWSLIGPIRQIETRLREIESGDFSGRVDVPNRDELGSLAANINRMNDELGRLYQELENASRHKSEFLANMSHELRTPLNAIIGFSQVLRQEMFGELNAKQAEYLDDILGSGQHLLSLINDILDLAKVEAGRMELQPSVFALDDLLRGSAAMVRERATANGVTLETEIDPSIGEIEADERKLKQILFNLLSNAVKFTPNGGRVALRAVSRGHRVEITVRDTGIGISPEDQARIFEEFYQVGPGNAQEGTGLGLALTRRLVELHGGRLTVESEPGAGSAFTVTLPMRQGPAEEEAAADVGQEAGAGTQIDATGVTSGETVAR